MPEPRAKKKKGPRGPLQSARLGVSAFEIVLTRLAFLLAVILLALRLRCCCFSIFRPRCFCC
ncbi:hypothetical protein CA238_12190 [Sphingomonas koreensis]|nr:hypothetical protein CA224_12480 [Sphingomonas koreensis]RSU41939.1 hypothetical protein BRX38_08690 [Sphingomonas koreensis]RSU86665.1 hypothetical protein CA253_16740 [Sphingomonas koreensis]RSV24129.1 hypothetical protein CA238_12190 [Sphingomonas koreensis]RSV53118.1 hypothetical protein CA229_17480 [Sphingomonas koreensis]